MDGDPRQCRGENTQPNMTIRQDHERRCSENVVCRLQAQSFHSGEYHLNAAVWSS
ncbi:hypothetical protein [Paenibacillus sp. 1001270B_150601_E10]|uniref:hypothetical protein n=1 Tax=Paenibacillus sp. 1001270B_150601_E10 TaxID=2787079 RepID=UPI0018A0F9DC|nr:hypothetical protein [Paenibacillus sp. 1001270B_150601_E10]